MANGEYVFITLTIDRGDPDSVVQQSQRYLQTHPFGVKLVVLSYLLPYKMDSLQALTVQIKDTGRQNYDFYYPKDQVRVAATMRVLYIFLFPG